MTIEELIALNDRRNLPTKPKVHHAHPEHDLQTKCVRWFRGEYPEYADLLWATPNGVYCSKKSAARIKAEGMVAGVPDLQLAVMRGGYGGLFIEMKNGNKGRLSEAQKVMRDKLQEQGFAWYLCRTEEEFHNVIISYLK